MERADVMDRSVPAVAGPRLSAIICTFERYNVLVAAVESLLAQDLPAGWLEIIVVDNSPDRVAAYSFGLRYARVMEVRYVITPEPGLSHARNVGVSMASAPLVAFLDDDAVALPGWGAAVLAGFELFGAGVGAVGGPARPFWLAPRPGWLTDDLLGHLSILDFGEVARILPAPLMIVGCNMAFNRALLGEIGGFNVKLGRLGPELTLRSNGEPGVLAALRGAGREIGYVPGMAVKHCIDPSRLTQAWFRRRVAWQAVSDFLMDPVGIAAHAPRAARHLRMVELSGERGRAVGFFGEAADGPSFTNELFLLRELMIATLHGGAELDVAAPAVARGGLSRLGARLWLGLRRGLRNSPQAAGAVRCVRRLMG